MAGIAGQPDFVSVVTAIDGAGYLTKIWRDPAGEAVEPAADVSLFNYQRYRITGLLDLHALLFELAQDPRSAVIRGDLKPELAAWLPHPRRSRDAHGAATVDDAPRYWVGVDLDDLDVPPWFEPEQIAAVARNMLPFPFSAAPCVWQLSASSGSAKKRSKGHVGVHLWFWLDEPRSSADLRAFFRLYPRVDRSLFKAVGLHFTADPVLPPGAVDPYAGRRLGMLDGFASASVPLLPPTVSAVPAITMAGGGDPVQIERFVSAMDRSGALRSKTGTVRREARLAFLDVLVNDLGFVGTESDLHDVFMRVCVGAGDEDGETDFVEAMNWAENPNADRIGVGSLFLEAEGSAMARGDVALLHELRAIKEQRHKASGPAASDMMAALAAQGMAPAGVTGSGAQGNEGAGEAPESDLMKALRGAGMVGNGASSAGGAGGAGDDEIGADPDDAKTAFQDMSGLLDDPENEVFERWNESGGARVRVPVLGVFDGQNIALKGEVNTRRMLKFLRVQVRWNDWLAIREISRNGEPWRKMIDGDWDSVLTEAHNPNFDFPVTETDFNRAVRSIIDRQRVDPMADYLWRLGTGDDRIGSEGDGLTLDNWLPAVAGIEDSPYHRAVGRYLVGSMVRRILMPGCKSDEMAVLISKAQGVGKSTICRLLAPTVDGRSSFTDALALGAEPKEVLEATGGIAVVEFSELAGSRGKEIEHVKAMLSRTEDSARPAYGRETVTRPRRFIMIGTSNDEAPLRDESGNRRFLPVRLRDDIEIDLERFLAAREGLWQQAVRELVLSDMAETFRLPRELWEEARDRQEAALGKGAAEMLLQDMFGMEAEAGTEWVSSKDMGLWRMKHGKMPDQTFSGAMKRLGFDRRVARESGAVLRRWVREGAGKEGSAQFLYSHERGTFERMPISANSGGVATFKMG